jgi:hypothetical protein
MNSLKEAQRAGIMTRLKQNKKYSVIVFYSGDRMENVAYARDFASVLKEAGWRVSGPESNERLFAEGLHIGVKDPRDPCPSASLLVDTLTAVGIDARAAPAGDFLSPGSPINCCLLLGP